MAIVTLKVAQLRLRQAKARVAKATEEARQCAQKVKEIDPTHAVRLDKAKVHLGRMKGWVKTCKEAVAKWQSEVKTLKAPKAPAAV